MWTFQRWMWKAERGGHERGIALLAGRTTCAQQRGERDKPTVNAAIWKEYICRERERAKERVIKMMEKRRMPGEQERLGKDKDVVCSTAALWWAEPGNTHTHTHLPASITLQTPKHTPLKSCHTSTTVGLELKKRLQINLRLFSLLSNISAKSPSELWGV